MSVNPARVVNVMLAWVAVAGAIPDGAVAGAALDELRALQQCRLADGGVAKIRGTTIVRDTAFLEFSSGRLHLFEPHVVAGDSIVTGALFLGDGRFRYVPPSSPERQHLKLLAGAESLSVAFSSVYLRFSSDLLPEWLPGLSPGARKDDRAEDTKRFCERFIDGRTALALLESLAAHDAPGFLYAQVAPLNRSAEPYVYTFDPSRVEEVRLERRVGRRQEHRTETYTSHRPMSAYESGLNLAHRTSAKLRPVHYDIDCEIQSRDHERGEQDHPDAVSAVMDVEAVDDLSRLLRFRLAPSLEIESVLLDSLPCGFSKLSGLSLVCVSLPKSVSKGDRINLQVDYKGDLVRRFGSGLFLSAPSSWYPRFESVARSTFAIRVRHPEDLWAIAVGEETKTEEKTVSRFRTNHPVALATFSLGSFSKFSFSSPVDSLPSVTVYALKERDAFRWFDWRDYEETMKEGIAHDFADATKFLSWLFGKCPVEGLVVTEVPYFVSTSYPELVHLSWVSFTYYDGAGGEESHRAHEVAHQWFGHAVQPRTYHDAWLAEGFSEFAGYW